MIGYRGLESPSGLKSQVFKTYNIVSLDPATLTMLTDISLTINDDFLRIIRIFTFLLENLIADIAGAFIAQQQYFYQIELYHCCLTVLRTYVVLRI